MNMKVRSKRKKKMNKQETKAVASNKEVRSKRKKKMFKMNIFFFKKKMNKKVAIRRNNKVRNYLNDHIMILILSKLPLKSLKRFECVCKSWATLFQNSYFKTIYSNNNNHYDDTYLVEQHNFGWQFYLLPGQRFEDRIKIDWPHPLQENDAGLLILDSVSINGILCLNQRSERRLVLWNPTTGEFKIILYSSCEDVLPPPRQPSYFVHGFGYDEVTNDYKVIQCLDSHILDEEEDEAYVIEDRSSYDLLWMIYSLKSDSWRKLDLNIPNRYFYAPKGAYTNGVCHWWARTDDSPNGEDNEEYLISFNFSNELLFTTLRPSYLDIRTYAPYAFGDRRLVVINESITLISTVLEMDTIHISILGEIGNRESWTKVSTITCLPSIESPIGVGNLSNRVLFRMTGEKLAWIDLNTKMMEEIDVEGASYVDVGKYKKSFLPIGGMNN